MIERTPLASPSAMRTSAPFFALPVGLLTPLTVQSTIRRGRLLDRDAIPTRLTAIETTLES